MFEKIKSSLQSPARFIVSYIFVNLIFFWVIGIINNFNYAVFWSCDFFWGCWPSLLGIVRYILIFGIPLLAIPLFGLTKKFFFSLIFILIILTIFNFGVFNYYSKQVDTVADIRSIGSMEHLSVENFSYQLNDGSNLTVDFIINTISLKPSKNYVFRLVFSSEENGEEIKLSNFNYYIFDDYYPLSFNISKEDDGAHFQEIITKRGTKKYIPYIILGRDESSAIQKLEPKIRKSEYLCSLAIVCGQDMFKLIHPSYIYAGSPLFFNDNNIFFDKNIVDIGIKKIRDPLQIP